MLISYCTIINFQGNFYPYSQNQFSQELFSSSKIFRQSSLRFSNSFHKYANFFVKPVRLALLLQLVGAFGPIMSWVCALGDPLHPLNGRLWEVFLNTCMDINGFATLYDYSNLYDYWKLKICHPVRLFRPALLFDSGEYTMLKIAKMSQNH